MTPERTNVAVWVVSIILTGQAAAAGLGAGDLFSSGSGAKISMVAPDRPDPLARYACAELARHIKAVTGFKPIVVTAANAKHDKLAGTNVLAVGRLANSAFLKPLAEKGFFTPNRAVQGYSIRIDANPFGPGGKTWMAVLCGADPLGTLYAVRDFCHYHLYKERGQVVLLPARVELAPRIKARVLSASGCNLFGKRDYGADRAEPKLNRYFLDWLSEWKATHVLLFWCNDNRYDPVWKDLIDAAHARGLKILRGFVPYRPDHEHAPSRLEVFRASKQSGEPSNCPRDPEARKWYADRVVRLVTQEPRIDGLVIESPYHDGVCCSCPKCAADPVAETVLMDELFGVAREARPDMVLARCIKRPVPDEAAARRLAAQLEPLDRFVDWYYNTYRDRDHRKRWHAIGPKCATYLRTYRSALKGKDVAREIEFLFNDFRMSAERDVRAHGFCYRFYGGRYGSFRVEDDRAILEVYPDKKGPFSLALVCEAAFDPFVTGQARARKIERIRTLTVPDYPRETIPPIIRRRSPAESGARPGKFFRYHCGIDDPSFCGAQVCVDFDNDGKREIIFGSRKTHRICMLNASDGKVVWSVPIPGDYQTVSAYDLDGDGEFEIVLSTSSPGRLYMLDKAGKIVKTWDSGDWKLGNSPVIIDADGDGTLDGYLGSRAHYLIRMNMRGLTVITRRTGWVQCGCQTSAMDVDGDGKWDLFAGSGGDRRVEGVLHRYDPITLKSLWSFAIGDNASSADPVLVDIDGDGRVEIVKSVDDCAKDGGRNGVFALETDGTLLWKVEGIAGEDTPNVGDLDGDGQVDIVGMTFGGEVYRLDSKGQVKWRKDLRPELGDDAGAYMAPILCDVNGDERLEILAMTNGGYADKNRANGVLFALSAKGDVLDRFDVGGPRFWGHAFYCNIDDDPTMELVVSGSGGLDVIKTRGLGPNTEHFQRRRSYRRLNVVPWAYEDEYFIYRGKREGVSNQTDNLILCRKGDGYRRSGRFVSELLTVPPGCVFNWLRYKAHTPPGTAIAVRILDSDGSVILDNIKTGQALRIPKAIQIEFELTTTKPDVTPKLDAYSLSFGRAAS